MRLLQSGLAASMLLLYTSGQIGSTYGEFNDSQGVDTQVELCKVFPDHIEQLLLEFSGHVQSIAKLKLSLSGYETASFSGVPDIDGLSLEEFDQAAERLAGELAAANLQLGALEEQLSRNADIWQQILQEINRAADVLAQIGGNMADLEPNCLEIRDARFLEEFKSSINQSGVLSESLTDTLHGILHYLSSIQQIGESNLSRDPDEISRQLGNSGFASRDILSFTAQAYSPSPGISGSLLYAYEQLESGLNTSKAKLSSDISSLQSQQEQLEGTRLRLVEEARKLEEERLELEKQLEEKKKQEEAAEAKKAEAPPETQPEAPAPTPAPTSLPLEEPLPGSEAPGPSSTPAEEPVEEPAGESIAEPADETPAPETASPEAAPVPGTSSAGNEVPGPTATPLPASDIHSN
ncbi:hypothetical protein [Paenibacillus albidus]|uniref:hypothetical protein n=1 Tax=Paenibacillus albidus TaxID=2041023 RepID=UPI001BEB1DE3|nr:hypothetical protein [Paenibacillus albidus]